jgi:hypothetical protein
MCPEVTTENDTKMANFTYTISLQTTIPIGMMSRNKFFFHFVKPLITIIKATSTLKRRNSETAPSIKAKPY